MTTVIIISGTTWVSSPRPCGSVNSLAGGPSEPINPRQNRLLPSADAVRPFGGRQGFTTHCEQPVIRFVSLLFLCRSPSAVTRFIIAVCVNALNGCSWRSLAHVSEKVFEGLPAVANRNSAPAISVKMYVARTLATLAESLPRIVSWAGCPCRVSMRGKLGHECLNAQAPARSSVAIVECRRSYGSAPATVAPAVPQSVTHFSPHSPRRHRQSSKATTLKICNSGHKSTAFIQSVGTVP